MQLVFGNYQHALNEAAVAIEKTPILNDAGLMFGMREAWTITGFLQALTQDLVAVAALALELAYTRNYQTIALIGNDGTILKSMAGRNSLGGTRVIGGVSFPESGMNTAEFSTYRQYQIRVEGTYPTSGSSQFTLLRFLETMSFTGGGPRFLHLQPLIGLPQRQQVAQATPFKVTQRGNAVGLYAYPVPPPPVWPIAEHIDQRVIDYESPKRSGDVVASVYTEWPVTWSYYFEANVPLTGAPTLWRG